MNSRRAIKNGKPVPAWKRTLREFLEPTIESTERVRAKIAEEFAYEKRRSAAHGPRPDEWKWSVGLRDELKDQDRRISDVQELHARLVREAVVRGEPVTKKVLADYPELLAMQKSRGPVVKRDEYAYGLVSRPAAPGSVPRGRIRTEASDEFRHGIVVYEEPLSDEDVSRYELIPTSIGRSASRNPQPARSAARNPAPARTVTFDVTYPDGGEDAWPWSDKFSRASSWHGIEEWLKGVKRHVPRYGVSVLVIKERGRTVAIYNAALAPRVHWRGSDVRIYRDAGYTDPAWLHGPVQSYDYSTEADGTIASREGLVGEVPPLPVVVGREAAKNGRRSVRRRGMR